MLGGFEEVFGGVGVGEVARVGVYAICTFDGAVVGVDGFVAEVVFVIVHDYGDILAWFGGIGQGWWESSAGVRGVSWLVVGGILGPVGLLPRVNINVSVGDPLRPPPKIALSGSPTYSPVVI